MWPFNNKTRYVKAKAAGTVDLVMFDHIIVDDRLYYMRVMLVEQGQAVSKGQILGKK